MAFSTTDLNNIKSAIASGELTVRFADGRETTYRSMSDLLQAKKTIEGELYSDSTSAVRQVRLYSRKF